MDTMELQDWLNVILDYLKVVAWPVVVFVLALVYRRPLIRVLERIKKATAPGLALELNEDSRELAGDAIAAAVETALDTRALAMRELASRVPIDPESPSSPELANEPSPEDPADSPPDVSTADRTTSILRSAFEKGWQRSVDAPFINNPDWTPSTTYKREWSEEAIRAHNAASIADAWSSVQIEADRVRALLDAPMKKARLSRITKELADRGLIVPGAVDIAEGLESLRGRILHSTEIPTEETLGNFATSASVLAALLRNGASQFEDERRALRLQDIVPF